MLIKQKQDGSKGSFYVEEAGTVLAEMTWSMTGTGFMIIDHTEVSDAMRGKMLAINWYIRQLNMPGQIISK